MEDISCFNALTNYTDGNAIPLNTNGATCDTYLVYYHGRKCFQKKLKPTLWDNPRYMQAFQKEYELGSRLEHPNLVRYYSHDDTSIYMEYVDGLTITDYLLDNPTYFQRREHVKRFLDELLSALGYMHQNQVLHLDLKPENIMLTHIGHAAKIIDLGFSYADAYDSTTGHTASYTTTEINEHADLYALAKVLEYIKQHIKKAAIPNKLIRQLSASESVEQFYELQQKARQRNKLAVAAMLVILLASSCCYLWNETHPKERWAGLLQEAHPGAISPTDAEKGIYIVDWEGNLVHPDSWNAAYRAIAVALISDSTHARIALTDLPNQVVWGDNTFVKPLTHTNDTTLGHATPGNAIEDYRGAYNTRIFMRTNHPDPSAVLGASTYLFPDGMNGYLPALGECCDLWNHLADINAALNKCDGDELSQQHNWYWTSTQDYTYYRAWSINLHLKDSLGLSIFANLRNEESPYAAEYGAPKLSVRPFGELE